MGVESAADLAGMFGTAEHAAAGTYTPAAGGPVTIAAILFRPETRTDAGAAELRVPGWSMLLRRTEIPAPRRGDAVPLPGIGRFTVAGRELDDSGAVWTIRLQPA